MADELFKLKGTIEADNTSAKKAIDETITHAQTAATSLSGHFASIGKTFSGLGSTLSGIGKTISGTVTAGVVGLGVSTAKTAVSFLSLKEGARTAFSVLLGSAEAANEMLDELYTFAKTTPFSYDTYLKAGKTLAAMGIEAENVIPYLDGITNASIGIGLGQAGVETLSQAIGRMASTGKVTLEILNVLTYNGIPAVKILANQYNVTTQEMFDLISKGKILAEEALPALLEGMQNGTDGAAGLTAAYGGLAKQMKGNLAGATDSMHSAFRNAAIAMWNAEEAFPHLIGLIQEFTKSIKFLPDIFQALHNASVPTLEKITGWLQTLNDKLANADEEKLAKVGKVILGLAAAGPTLIAVGKGFTIAGKAMSALSTITNKLTPAFKKANDGLKNWSSNTKTKLSEAKGHFKNAFSDIKEVFSSLGSAVRGLAAPIVDPLIVKFADLKNKVGEKISGLADTIKNKLSTVKTVTSGIFGNVTETIKNKVGGWGNAISTKLAPIKDKISSAFSGIADRVGTPLANAFGKAKSAMGNFGKGIGAMGGVFGGVLKGAGLLSAGLIGLAGVAAASGVDIQAKVDGMVQKVTDFATNLPTAMNNLIPALQNGLTQIIAVIPQLVTGITEALTAIAGALPELLPQLISGITTLITSLVPVIVEFIPMIIDAGVQLLMGLVNAIPQILPPLLAAIPQIITAIVSALPTFISTIVTGGVQLLMGIVDAIPQILPPLVDAIPTIVNAITTALPELVPQLLDAGIQLLMALVNAIPQILPPLVEALPQIINTLITTLTSNIPMLLDGAVQLFMAIVQAIPQIVVELGKAVPDIINGIISGLSAGWEAIKTAASDLGKQFLDAFKSFFGINSPATVMIEQGGHIVNGLVNGVKDIVSKVGGIFANLKNNIVNKVTELKTNAVNKFDELKAGFKDKASSIFNTVKDKFVEIKNKIVTPIKEAKDKAKEYIDKIKDFFTGFSAHIKLPHFSIKNASLNPKSWIENGVPKLSVEWYKKGGIFAEGVLERPTAFGISPNGNTMVGGEAGAEAVAPISKLQEYVAAAATSGNAELGEKLDNLISLLTLYLPMLLNRQMVVDSGAVIAEFLPLIDEGLGNLTQQKARGRA